MKLSTMGVVAALALLGACEKNEEAAPSNGDPAAGAPAQVQEDLGDMAKYRLTMDKVDKYIAAQRNFAVAVSRMTPAERAAAEAENDSEDNNNATIEDMASNIEKNKVYNDAVKDAGLSAREYTMVMMAIMQAGMAMAIQKMRPNDDADSLAREMKTNPDNVRFYRENEAELTRKMEAAAAEMKRLGVDE